LSAENRPHVGVDTGGTFTDLVVVRNGKIRITKVPSTPPHFEEGIVDAVVASGVSAESVGLFAHGTTATTNAIITKTGAKTALVTTAGFRDVLELRRHNRGDLYDIMWDPPAPLVPRRARFEVTERSNYAGEVLVPLDQGEAQRLAERISSDGYEAVAVVFLHSYAAPTNEALMRRLLEDAAPHAYVVDSASLLPEEQEFERTATTVANAYVGPVFSGYVKRLAERLSERGHAGTVFVMHSGGGLLPASSMERVPVRTVMSGPAAGVIAAAEISRRAERRNVITLDMGGTSADIATVIGGEVGLRKDYTPEFGLPIRFPTIDLVTVGAGGGSIAWIDSAGSPKVGPQSAGARPGPAAYAQGGTEATVTDANLVLGRLSPDRPLAGGLSLDANLAQTAVGEVARRLGLSPIEAADGIIRIANANMVRFVRVMTVERGLDPRNFSLLAFGGAGPMHGVELAQELNIPQVIIPPWPGVTAALGLLFADVVHDYSYTLVQDERAIDYDAIRAAFSTMEERATQVLAAEGFPVGSWSLEPLVDIRYVGQVKALTLGAESLIEGDFESLRPRFYAEYEQRYRYFATDLPLELSAVRLRARARLPRPTLSAPAVEPSNTSATTRRVWFGRRAYETVVLARATLRPGDRIEGPAVIEQIDATTVLPPDVTGRVDEHGNLLVRC
jgi:N-methylhydantoinase A